MPDNIPFAEWPKNRAIAGVARAMLTQARLKQLLAYDPSTGKFTWLVNRGGKAWAGTEAGAFRNRRGRADQGQRHIDVDGQRYMAGRLVWLYAHGCWPAVHIDHINGDTNDNRLCNLREASNQENHGNMRLFASNTTGAKGTYWHKKAGKYAAHITVKGRSIHLGLFDSLQAAHAAYAEAATKHFGRFARFE